MIVVITNIDYIKGQWGMDVVMISLVAIFIKMNRSMCNVLYFSSLSCQSYTLFGKRPMTKKVSLHY